MPCRDVTWGKSRLTPRWESAASSSRDDLHPTPTSGWARDCQSDLMLTALAQDFGAGVWP